MVAGNPATTEIKQNLVHGHRKSPRGGRGKWGNRSSAHLLSESLGCARAAHRAWQQPSGECTGRFEPNHDRKKCHDTNPPPHGTGQLDKQNLPPPASNQTCPHDKSKHIRPVWGRNAHKWLELAARNFAIAKVPANKEISARKSQPTLQQEERQEKLALR